MNNQIKKINVNGTIWDIAIPYSNVLYSANVDSSPGGALSLSGETPLHVITLTGDITELLLSANPSNFHNCHIIFTSSSLHTVTIKHNSYIRICPEGSDITLTVPANGYIEVDFLNINGNVYVRGA